MEQFCMIISEAIILFNPIVTVFTLVQWTVWSRSIGKSTVSPASCENGGGEGRGGWTGRGREREGEVDESFASVIVTETHSPLSLLVFLRMVGLLLRVRGRLSEEEMGGASPSTLKHRERHSLNN